jgi:hypothetical protein
LRKPVENNTVAEETQSKDEQPKSTPAFKTEA